MVKDKKKILLQIMIVLLCVGLNYAGRRFGELLTLPIWFDCVGTYVAAYFIGPVATMIVAVLSHIVLCISDYSALIYIVTSVIIAASFAYCAKKQYMDNVLKMIVSSFWIGLLCVIVSTPLNIIFYDGYSGNIWGDALADMLAYHGFSDVICALAGEIIVEIIDKQICIILAYLLLKVIKYFKEKNKFVHNLIVLVSVNVVLFSLAFLMEVFCSNDKNNVSYGINMGFWNNSLYKVYLICVCMELVVFAIWTVLEMINISKMKKELEERINLQVEQIRGKEEKEVQMFRRMIMALSDTVDAKDRYTSGHSRRVAQYSKMIAARMGKSEKEQDDIYYAGLLHDVGKIRVPGSVINKTERLTDEEFGLIKIHPVTGYRILKGISEDSPIAIGAKFHHERYDGKGYPAGLSGKNIPEVARIVAVADSYDAMASNRKYRDALPQDVVRNEIEKGKGTQFDPVVTEIMLQLIDEDHDYKMKEGSRMEKTILVVDDESMNIQMIQFILKDDTMYNVIGVESGQAALQLLDEQKVDLILLDIEMPVMNGFDTFKAIRKKTSIPVVFTTSDKEIETIQRAAELGVDDYLTKPFLPQILKEVVHSVMLFSE